MIRLPQEVKVEISQGHLEMSGYVPMTTAAWEETPPTVVLCIIYCHELLSSGPATAACHLWLAGMDQI